MQHQNSRYSLLFAPLWSGRDGTHPFDYLIISHDCHTNATLGWNPVNVFRNRINYLLWFSIFGVCVGFLWGFHLGTYIGVSLMPHGHQLPMLGERCESKNDNKITVYQRARVSSSTLAKMAETKTSTQLGLYNSLTFRITRTRNKWHKRILSYSSSCKTEKTQRTHLNNVIIS